MPDETIRIEHDERFIRLRKDGTLGGCRKKSHASGRIEETRRVSSTVADALFVSERNRVTS